MAAPTERNVDLGFIEESDNWLLLSHYFPNKIGGKPAWLSLTNIPGANELKCGNCGKTCQFLVQIYSPADKPSCFHRTIFVFVCSDPSCCQPNDSRNFLAFRSQLPKENDFYSSIPPKEDEFSWESPFPSAYLRKDQKLCAVCGCLGPKVCAKCHKRTYCSREHQVADWKSGHNKKCGTGENETIEELHAPHPSNFPEFQIVIENENNDAQVENEKAKSEAERLKEYEDFVETHPDKNIPVDDIKENEEDKYFLAFKERISLEPDQVIRYQIGATPLWVSDEHIPKGSDIPKCQCGAERQFEFQIMPQMLQHLCVDRVDSASIDWGTLLVYTCEDSCDLADGYAPEVVWKQDFSNTDLPEIPT